MPFATFVFCVLRSNILHFFFYCDQDSDVSFQEDADEEIDTTENEEDWIEYIKRSTKQAEEFMENIKSLKHTED